MGYDGNHAPFVVAPKENMFGVWSWNNTKAMKLKSIELGVLHCPGQCWIRNHMRLQLDNQSAKVEVLKVSQGNHLGAKPVFIGHQRPFDELRARDKQVVYVKVVIMTRRCERKLARQIV